MYVYVPSGSAVVKRGCTGSFLEVYYRPQVDSVRALENWSTYKYHSNLRNQLPEFNVWTIAIRNILVVTPNALGAGNMGLNVLSGILDPGKRAVLCSSESKHTPAYGNPGSDGHCL